MGGGDSSRRAVCQGNAGALQLQVAGAGGSGGGGGGDVVERQICAVVG
jgi:hypothetical protein